MAKYDWKQLEKEYILSDFKSVSQFIESKNMPYNGTTRKHTSGWKDKKRQKEDKKATKVIQKVTEKEIEREVDINTRHLNLYDKFLDIIEKTLNNENEYNYLGMPDYDKLKKMTDILEKAQKGQRLAKGLDTNKDNQDVIERLDKLLEEQKNA